ncbi:MAG: substrate-binding domain-containing protein [Rubrivivax sp.]|jgi:molybdate transport system substrate-binding protein|nr:substrate-binding domain-containing protein [Rubrivivax sp.]
MVEPVPIRAISSMATRALLAELAPACAASAGVTLSVESVGGVDAAKRVRQGEAFDLVILAADALDALHAEGRVDARIDLVQSGISCAVRAGERQPDVSTLQALTQALLGCRRVGVSTGPSGVQLMARFEAWGLMPGLRERVVQPPPGTPVGQWLALGEVDLAFQQTAELIHLPGLSLLAPLAADAQILTTFSGSVARHSTAPEAAQRVLAHLASAAHDDSKRRHGFEPVP